jgi:hypothetical protein
MSRFLVACFLQAKHDLYTVGEFMTKLKDLYVVKSSTTVDEGERELLLSFFRSPRKNVRFSCWNWDNLKNLPPLQSSYYHIWCIYFHTALELLVRNRVTGLPVVDDAGKLVRWCKISHFAFFFLCLSLSWTLLNLSIVMEARISSMCATTLWQNHSETFICVFWILPKNENTIDLLALQICRVSDGFYICSSFSCICFVLFIPVKFQIAISFVYWDTVKTFELLWTL